MDLKRLGRSDLMVPRMGLGCGALGGVKPMTDAEAHSVLDAAWREGIRYFDTSPWYGNTHSEHRVGRFLRLKNRDEFKITSKVGRLYSRPDNRADFDQSVWAKRWPGGLPFEPHFDFRRDAILRSYEDSMMRLGLPSIDGLAIHDLDIRHQKSEEGIARGFDQLEKGGGYKALSQLKERGEIKAIGVGINFAGLIPRFLERFEIDYFILAMPYTLLDQQALEVELPMCLEAGSSILIGAPFASGILATGAVKGAQYSYADASEDILNRVRQFEAIGTQFNVPISAAALQLPLGHPSVAGVIPGADTAEQVSSNMAAVLRKIPREYWEALVEQGLINSNTPFPEPPKQ